MKLLNEREVGEIYDQGKEAMVEAYPRMQEQIAGLMEQVSRLEALVPQHSQNSSRPSPKSLRKKRGWRSEGQSGHARLEFESIP